METFLIILVFVGIPLMIFGVVIFGAVMRAKRNKAVYDAAHKYLNS